MLMQRFNSNPVLLRGLWSAPAALVLFLNPANALAQCETDADCEFGFTCQLETGGTTGGNATASSTTAGTPLCGDGWCDDEEDGESCPDDCETYGYCVGAACQGDADCAAGYACLTPSQVYSTSTTGSSGAFCGNTLCEEGETEESCYSDCTTETTCQPAGCQTDSDCAEGHYCAVNAGSVSGGVSSSDGTSGHVTLYQNVCLPLSTDGGSGSGGAFGSGNTSTVSGGSDTTGAAGAAGDTGETDGGSGFSVVTSAANVASATSDGSTSGGSGGTSSGDSGSGGAGHGHKHKKKHKRGGKLPWPDGPGHGCSFGGGSELPSSPWSLAAAMALGFGFVRRRRGG